MHLSNSKVRKKKNKQQQQKNKNKKKTENLLVNHFISRISLIMTKFW